MVALGTASLVHVGCTALNEVLVNGYQQSVVMEMRLQREPTDQLGLGGTSGALIQPSPPCLKQGQQEHWELALKGCRGNSAL